MLTTLDEIQVLTEDVFVPGMDTTDRDEIDAFTSRVPWAASWMDGTA